MPHGGGRQPCTVSGPQHTRIPHAVGQVQPSHLSVPCGTSAVPRRVATDSAGLQRIAWADGHRVCHWIRPDSGVQCWPHAHNSVALPVGRSWLQLGKGTLQAELGGIAAQFRHWERQHVGCLFRGRQRNSGAVRPRCRLGSLRRKCSHCRKQGLPRPRLQVQSSDGQAFDSPRSNRSLDVAQPWRRAPLHSVRNVQVSVAIHMLRGRVCGSEAAPAG